MKKTTAWILVLTMLFAWVVLSVPALAETVTDDYAEGEVDASVFLAGQNTENNAHIQGLLCSAGYKVNSTGVSEYLIAAGYDIAVGGAAVKDAVLAGCNIEISGNIGRDVYAFGKNISISGTIGRNAKLAADSVSINGTVLGDLDITAGTILISENAVISGKLRYNSDADIVAPEKALQDAEIFESDVTDTEFFEEQPSATDLLLDAIKGIVFSYVGVLAVTMLLLWLTPLWETVDKKYENASFGKYAAAFGIGFAVLVALPLASVILMVTGFGLRLGFTLLMLYLAAMAVSPVFLSYILGKLLWRKAFKKAVNYPAELAIGVLAWRILASVPLLSFLVGFISLPFGIGVFVLLLGKKKTTAPQIPVSAEVSSAVTSEASDNE